MSEIKVNKISPRSGTTVTLGDSGDTFTIPSGATINNQGTAVNFGATGSASWVTTVKTSTFTAVAGEGYFVNTTGGVVTVNLPAGTAGAVVAIKDYANTFDTNAVTLAPNGSDKIGGDSTTDATLDIEGIAVTLVFVDSTQGWLVTDSGLQSAVPTASFISATGGTITNSGDCRIHTFTGPGTFQVCSVANVAANNEVSYVVVAGGGGGGGANSGSTGGAAGGGAGGYRETKSPVTPYTASPLDGQPSAPNRITVTATSFPITVGAGGSGVQGVQGNSGSVSTFSTITSAGGGGGGGRAPSPSDVGDGLNGGSGGGGSYGASQDGTAGSGNTPPTTPAQGNDGAAYSNFESGSRPGGGGGAGAAGFPAGGNCRGGNGGTGTTSSINGTPTARAGGGGGAAGPAPTAGGTGGPGGGADGSSGAASNAGTVNTGGGGGGRSGVGQPSNTTGGAGGSGIVIIRYKIA
jgi:hypothetical protein